jgi:hypothetical protein
VTGTTIYEIQNRRWPGGVGICPPTPRRPYWHLPSGERFSFPTILSGTRGEIREFVHRAHAEAIWEIAKAAAAALEAGEGTKARRMLAGASRLCGEPLGHWPDGSWRPIGG